MVDKKALAAGLAIGIAAGKKSKTPEKIEVKLDLKKMADEPKHSILNQRNVFFKG